MLNKRELRKTYYANRSKITGDKRYAAAQAAARMLEAHELFKRSRYIGCYWPVAGEFDSQPLINSIWRANKRCFLPVLAEERSLEFVRFNDGDVLALNQYAILEPQSRARKIAPDQLDLVITPVVAFDLEGHRLGTGGGYYDRTFAFFHGGGCKKPAMLGLAFTEQQADFIPSDPWDIRLDGVLTEKELILFK